ncbi:MAG TPA: hypothetical protein VNJ53_02850 [Gaiellaceae bacterium]|nr:hypothetical protein [Gaiellaceae bacterium]
MGTLKRLAAALAVVSAALFVVSVTGAAPGTGASVDEYDQCANGAPPSTSTGCPSGWINGILQGNNSHYSEDEVVPQRVVLELPEGGPTTGRTIEIAYLTRKGGVHAYDSLATWNTTQTSADRCAGINPASACPGGSPSTFPIPLDGTVVADKFGSGSATSAHQLTGQVFTMYGGTITGVSGYTHDDPSGTSDSYARITVTYSVPSLAADARVMLLFGGHLAPSLGPRGWGAGLGAGSINGGPYHIRITKADGESIGSRDNQIQSSAILAPANVVIRKVTVGGDGTFGFTSTGGLSPSSFSITTSSGSGSQSFPGIAPGSYTVTESGPPSGWNFTSVTCEDEDNGSSTTGQTANIDLDAGETVTCTFTNTLQPGSLTVIKHVVNDDGGTATAGNWTMNVAGPTPLSFAGAESPGTTSSVSPGSYTVTESGGPSGYTLSYSGDCDASGNVTVGPGQSKTCTLTNDDQPASLTVIKHVVNDSGGTAVAGDWTMNVAGPTAGSFAGAESPGVTRTVDAGAYKITESGGPSGYTLSYSGDCDADGDVSLAPGQSKTCTLTNDDNAAKLVVIKTVVNDNGGTKVASDFPIQVTGNSPSPASFAGAASPGTEVAIGPGSYSVTETEDPGYAASYSADCTGTIALGQTKTCTITNDDKAARLIVVKHVVNDDGGTKVASDFDIQVAGSSPSPGSFDGAESPGTEVAIGPGAYEVTETEDPGYAASYSAGCEGTIALGETKTCTITNDDKAASLVVIKNVVNDDGGTRVASDFAIQVSGNGASPASFAGAASPGTEVAIGPGSYSVTETEDPGYAASYSADCAGTIALGQTKTCTITNDDRPASLTVIKHVVNDNGGSAAASAWTMNVAGPTPLSFAGAESPGVTNAVDAGAYKITESGGPTGYGLTYSGDCDADGDVTLAPGQSKTCTLTNDDVAATLTVVKHVVNDNGGTADASDFTMSISGVTAAGGNSFAGAESPGVTKTLTSVGAYSVSESSVAGYEQTGASADCEGTIALGEHKTCTITNDDRAPKLTLVKVVVNDNGGTAAPSAWTLSADGPTDFSGSGPSVSSGASFDQGSYDLSESGPAGYEASDWECTDGQEDGDTVEVGLGDDITCTITNDDREPKLTLVKVVVNDNGGTASASSWTLSASGPTGFSGSGPSISSGTGFDQGSYDLSEAGPAGYDASAWSCTAGQVDGDTVQVGLGDDVTCTITNDDRAPKLTLVKVVVNDDGGTAAPSAWTLSADGPTDLSGPGPSVSSGASFDQGSYDLSESGPAGYEASDWECTGESQSDADTVQVGLGDDVTCTITNDDLPATLIVRKVVVNDNGGTATASDFTFRVNGGQPVAFEADGQNDLVVPAGDYDVVEPAVAGYTTTYQGCENIDLGLGETATCTITNNDVPRGRGSISVSKAASPGSLKEPGGQVTYSVTVSNTSADTNVVITSVVDDKFGDLDDEGGKGYIDVPFTLLPGQSRSFQFTAQVNGVGGSEHVNVVTASGNDTSGNSLSASDDARVQITERLIDLVIQKDATSPTPLNGTVTYTLTVTNRGPDTATNVQLADPAPAGITYLGANPSQGSCSVTASLVTCSLGSLAPGQTVTVTVTGRATQTGQHTNTATVTGSGGRETNPADNVDSAVTVVPAPLRPPTAKPKPEPEVCLALTVSPKMIKADGKPDRITVTVTAGKKRVKGVRVVVSGPGVRQSARTNGRGVAVLRINPRKAGLLTVTALEPNRRICGPKRIGVVGVFLPPLTG